MTVCFLCECKMPKQQRKQETPLLQKGRAMLRVTVSLNIYNLLPRSVVHGQQCTVVTGLCFFIVRLGLVLFSRRLGVGLSVCVSRLRPHVQIVSPPSDSIRITIHFRGRVAWLRHALQFLVCNVLTRLHENRLPMVLFVCLFLCMLISSVLVSLLYVLYSFSMFAIINRWCQWILD